MKGAWHTIKTRVWEWEGKGAWHFATIEKDDAKAIKQDWPWPRKGFGSIPVVVKIGTTEWKTSIFPDKDGTYLLPIKKSVRTAEAIKKGDTVVVHLVVVT